MLSISILFFSFPCMVLSLQSFTILTLPSTTIGPDSLAFDWKGEGPYTGVSDGRILKYQGPKFGFVDFAFTKPNRSKVLCDGNIDPNLGPVCGRPLGLGFNYQTRELYITDAYLGLHVARPNGGLAIQLATSAEGVPFRFLDSLDIDPNTGIVYFTDASAKYTPSEIELAVAANDTTGRFLKYDPNTKQVTVLLRGLSGAAGTAVSSDSSFVLLTEFIADRIQKYWLTGPKANTAEILVNFTGRPDNIKRTASGNFSVAVNIQKPPALTNVPTAIKINGFGTVLETVPLDAQYGTTLISEVQDFGGARYVGSLFTNFVGVYKY